MTFSHCADELHDDDWSCDLCDYSSSDRGDLDDDLRCPECAEEVETEQRAERELRSDYLASIL